MATLTISVSGSTVASGTRNYTITDANLNDLLLWARAEFATTLSSSPTNPQIMLAWVQNWIDDTKYNVLRFKRDQLAATASGITIST